jgi:2-oxoglutarate dehydrogenase E2 component (dihydrolipoamide succinyltransferase)
MRRGIAEHMRRSLDTSAHVTSAIEVDMSNVVAIRKKLKSEYQRSYGVNPTYLSFIARATVETLHDYPWINGELRGDQIVTRNYVNLGFAVELADGKGLIVPVVKHAEGPQPARDGALGRRDRPAGTRQEAAARRRPGRHVHDHQPRRLRHLPRHARDQSAAGRDPRHLRRREAAVGDPGRPRRGRDRDPADHEPDAHVRPPLVDGALAGRFLRDLRQRLETWDETNY